MLTANNRLLTQDICAEEIESPMSWSVSLTRKLMIVCTIRPYLAPWLRRYLTEHFFFSFFLDFALLVVNRCDFRVISEFCSSNMLRSRGLNRIFDHWCLTCIWGLDQEVPQGYRIIVCTVWGGRSCSNISSWLVEVFRDSHDQCIEVCSS